MEQKNSKCQIFFLKTPALFTLKICSKKIKATFIMKIFQNIIFQQLFNLKYDTKIINAKNMKYNSQFLQILQFLRAKKFGWT